MEEIDLKELFTFFKKRLVLILLIICIVALIGSLYGVFFQTPKYKSSARILLKSEDVMTNSDVMLNQNLIKTYSEIVKSKRILNQTINNLSLEYEYEELCQLIDVGSDDNSQLIVITVVNENPVLARDIANDIAIVFKKEIPSLYKISNVNILDRAEVAKHPFNINFIKQNIIILLVGSVLSMGIVFIMFYFDNSIKSTEQIDNKIDLPLLGTVSSLRIGDK